MLDDKILAGKLTIVEWHSAGRKGGVGMCTVQKDYLQGKSKKKKGDDAEDEELSGSAHNFALKGKQFDR